MAHVHGPDCAHGAEQPRVQMSAEQQQALAQQQQEMTDLRSEPYKKVALELAQFLRHNATLKNKSGVLDGKRVEYFKGVWCFVCQLLTDVVRQIMSESFTI